MNFYGDSDFSPAGNGAIIVLIPDAPISFTNNPAITNEDQISMTWVDGLSDGGEPILDYRIVYDQSIGNYMPLVEGLIV